MVPMHLKATTADFTCTAHKQKIRCAPVKSALEKDNFMELHIKKLLPIALVSCALVACAPVQAPAPAAPAAAATTAPSEEATSAPT